jgi:cytochrome c biogenesis protein CcdA/thiol-disulfide isomerase/thioredoxin
MTFLVISFIAGVLTVLAPCILPLLPVVIGSSAAGRSRATPYVVVGSLALSIILFTYLLKASTAFITVPPEVWTYLSGGILILFGLTLVFPALWERLPGLATLSSSSNQFVGGGYQRKSFWGDVLIGAGLGPVFSTCSPTYFVILASVLPASFLLGTVYLFAYVLGLSLVLLMIALLGERFAGRLSGFADSRGWFKRGIGVLFILLGLMIASGFEKKLETKILESGVFDVTQVEQYLLQQQEVPMVESVERYKEIADPAGFVNTDQITLGELVGKKVILVDFMTYSCINCQRTFPYLVAWYEKYKDEGLEIVGIHTPEFAFEKDIDNVQKAMEQFGITYPVVLDNDYATWRAYGNNYWPRKYLIDIHGNIVYDHIGEGGYEETERKIQELLRERAQLMGAGSIEDTELAASTMPPVENSAQSPETYLGSLRNEYLANGTPGFSGERAFIVPTTLNRNALYLGGTWSITREYAQAGASARVLYRYSAKDVYLVMESDEPADVEVWQDGKLLKTFKVQESTLYTLVEDTEVGEHLLELRINPGVRVYAFTFG